MKHEIFTLILKKQFQKRKSKEKKITGNACSFEGKTGFGPKYFSSLSQDLHKPSSPWGCTLQVNDQVYRGKS
jgi:hypothetical protein